MSALPVFAIAFTNYIGFFVPLSQAAEIAPRVAFLATLTMVNVADMKAAGRVSDVLTVLKLGPLLLMVIVGLGWAVLHVGRIADAYTPYAPFGFGQFSHALMLIIYAYAGFELTTLSSAEVQSSERTIPRAIAIGIAIVALFYVSRISWCSAWLGGTPCGEEHAVDRHWSRAARGRRRCGHGTWDRDLRLRIG